ncbi:Uncharacterized protein DBV15_07582 [Temnothorax longispinosus]|uniref:Uncharacterized protein n=1 Tax=Temnothorax longispinosus TaxID=300112 RepID=A0A4S2L5I1_9HYME|nr:Uncharacterized protein DBV15_07582 [Temnothorax longispinosus]
MTTIAFCIKLPHFTFLQGIITRSITCTLRMQLKACPACTRKNLAGKSNDVDAESRGARTWIERIPATRDQTSTSRVRACARAQGKNTRARKTRGAARAPGHISPSPGWAAGRVGRSRSIDRYLNEYSSAEKGSYSGTKLMTDNPNRSQCDSKEEFPRSRKSTMNILFKSDCGENPFTKFVRGEFLRELHLQRVQLRDRSRKVARLSLCGSISRRRSGDVMSYGVTLDLQVRRVNQLLSLNCLYLWAARLHNAAFDLSFDLLVSPVSLITFPSQEFWHCKANDFRAYARYKLHRICK